MSERQVSIGGLVSLPRMKARELLAVARALVALGRAAPHLLPHIEEALDDLEAQLPELAAALGVREKKPAVSVKAADQAEDNAVGALADFAAAWKRLPAADFPREVGVATACLEVIHEGAGLEFLTYKPVVEHSEVQRRLDSLKARKLDAALRKMGGGPFLDHLEKVHAVYGAVAGATERAPQTETPAVRAATTEVAESVRAYVVRVLGMVNRKRPATREQVDALLEPLTRWTATNATADTTSDDASDVQEGVPTNPAPPVAPANDDATEKRKVG